MGEGEQTSDMIPQDEWNYPKPNSISEIMYNKICEKFVGEKTEIVVNKKEKGVLYESKVNGELGWYKSGDEKTDWKYEGEVENGKPNGQGTMTSPDGSIYEGKFKDGRQNGQGTMTLIKGGEILGKYVGEFKNDSPNGQGTTTLFSGGDIVEKYVGEHKNYKYHGQGTKTFKDDRKHIGEWKDGKPNGKGKVLYPDGRKINGEYIDGKLDGQGTITYPNGRKFVGEFRKDKPWNVTGYDKDGNILGKFVNGENQEVIEKKGIGGKKQEVIEKKGIGVIYSRFDYVNQKWGWFKSGNEETDSKYVGEIEDGKPNGQGTTTYPSGNKWEGEWKDGEMWNGTLTNKNGKIRHKIVNGEDVEP